MKTRQIWIGSGGVHLTHKPRPVVWIPHYGVYTVVEDDPPHIICGYFVEISWLFIHISFTVNV